MESIFDIFIDSLRPLGVPVADWQKTDAERLEDIMQRGHVGFETDYGRIS